MSDESDRVIPATPRRREAARRQGAMPTAAVPAWVATAGTAVVLLPAWAGTTLPAAADLVRGAISAAGRGAVDEPLPPLGPVIAPTAAVIVAAAAAGIGVRLLCDGFSWQPARTLPTLGRIDPFAGLARIFSWRTLAGAAGAGVGLGALAVVAVSAIEPLLSVAAASGGLPEAAAVAAAAWRSAAWLLAAAAFVATGRWLLARRRFEQRIRMTPEEFAEEARSAQADPKVRLLQQRRQPASGAA